MRRSISMIALLSLLLGACSDMPRTWRKSEIEEIASSRAEDFADAGSANVSDELSSRIQQLEQRIDDLEREKRDLESRVSYLELQ